MQFSRMSNKQVDQLFAQLLSNCSAELKQERKRRAKERQIEADAERIRQLKISKAEANAIAEVRADYELKEEVLAVMVKLGIPRMAAAAQLSSKRALMELAMKYEVI